MLHNYLYWVVCSAAWLLESIVCVNYCMYRVFHSQSATCVLPVWIPAHEEHIKSVSLRVSFWSGCCLWRLPVCTAESEIPHRNRVYVFENKSLVDNSLTFTSVSQQMLTTVSGGFTGIGWWIQPQYVLLVLIYWHDPAYYHGFGNYKHLQVKWYKNK